MAPLGSAGGIGDSLGLAGTRSSIREIPVALAIGIAMRDAPLPDGVAFLSVKKNQNDCFLVSIDTCQ